MRTTLAADPAPVTTPVPTPDPTPTFLLPRPANPIMKALLKGPILAWRLGLGGLVGRRLLILTTTGRRSGRSRHTALGFTAFHGRNFVLTLRGPGTDWYRNVLADPHVTIQTVAGSEPVLARRVATDAELSEVYP